MDSQDSSCSYSANSVDYVASTKIEIDTFSFIWSIHNFSMQSFKDGIRSPEFIGGPKTEHFWGLDAKEYEKTVEGNTTKYLSLYLRMCETDGNDQEPPVKAYFKFCILDQEDKPVLQRGPANYQNFTSLPRWGYKEFVTIEELSNSQKRYVIDDKMKIHCRIWIQCEPTNTLITNNDSTLNMQLKETGPRQLEQLGRDFKTCLSGSAFYDVSVVTTTKTFQAHKVVLSARSRVFNAMFESSMLESIQNSVEIPDFEEDIVHSMLEYMYSGQTLVSSGNVRDLFRIADKYELMGLKELCEIALGQNLKIENACELLSIAHLHNAQHLKAKIMTFINLNRKNIVKTKGFKELGNVDPLLFQHLYLAMSP